MHVNGRKGSLSASEPCAVTVARLPVVISGVFQVCQAPDGIHAAHHALLLHLDGRMYVMLQQLSLQAVCIFLLREQVKRRVPGHQVMVCGSAG